MRQNRRDNPFSLFSFQDIITGLCGIMIFVVLVQMAGLVLERRMDDSVIKSSDDSEKVREDLKSEIAELELELNAVKAKAVKAVVISREKARPEDVAKVNDKLTERELIVAALVSQVHDLETQVEQTKKANADSAANVREMEHTRRLLEQQIADMKKRRGVTLIPERGEFKIPAYAVCSWAGLDVFRPFEKKLRAQIPIDGLELKLEQYLEGLDHTTHVIVLLVRPSGVSVMNQVVAILKNGNFSFGRDPLEENVEIVFDAEEAK